MMGICKTCKFFGWKKRWIEKFYMFERWKGECLISRYEVYEESLCFLSTKGFWKPKRLVA